MLKEITSFDLKSENIDKASETLWECLIKAGENKRNAVRMRLAAEEILIKLRDHYGTDMYCSIVKNSNLRGVYYEIVYKETSDDFDPTEKNIFSEGTILAELGIMPELIRKSGMCRVTISPSQKAAGTTSAVFVAMFLGILFGIAGKNLFPQHCDYIDEQVLSPIFDIIMSLIQATAVFAVFLFSVSGICSMNSIRVLKYEGKRLIIRSQLTMLAASALAMLTLPFFHLDFGNTGAKLPNIGEIISGFSEFIPHDFISPFIEYNFVHAIILGIVFGAALLSLGDHAANMIKLINETEKAVGIILLNICRLSPVVVFILLVQEIWHGDITSFCKLWRPALVFFVLEAILLSILYISVSLQCKIKIRRMLHYMFPSVFLAFTTASTFSAYGESMECLTKHFRVNDKTAAFALPISSIISAPSSGITLITLFLFSAETYHIQVNMIWLISLFIAGSLIGFLMPPLPGIAFAMYQLLIVRFGLPVSALTLIMTLDAVLDFFITAADVAARQLIIVAFAKNKIKD